MSKLGLLLGSVLLFVPLAASAQPAEAPAAVEAAGHEGAAEAPEDPSLHFNFLNFSYSGKDELGGEFGDGKMVDEKTGEVVKEEEKMSPPFILMLVNFGILLILLAKFGLPAARKTAEDRSDQIKTALEEAGALRQEAASKLAEYETKLKDADTQITKMVEDLRADAASEKARIIAAAEAQAVALQKDAEQRIAVEIDVARASLAREVALAATAAAEKLVVAKATPADHAKLVDTFLADLAQVVTHRATTTQVPKEKA
jgi:F-type H+-transporting ATPase subunit b